MRSWWELAGARLRARSGSGSDSGERNAATFCGAPRFRSALCGGLSGTPGTAEFPEPPSPALPLGLGAHGDAGPRPCQVGFAQDEQLLLHTDGVTEARDEDGHF
ncbi:SpoIIE family protein phosphatase [Streptomyces scabiei]|uniref:SpoIIE family protein phosphatase n=1 Tax=Streptomyces scabiei TaxID=1930 RepID=UPI003F75BB73